MPEWKIDSTGDLLALVFIVLVVAALFITIVVLLIRAKIKVSLPGGAGIDASGKKGKATMADTVAATRHEHVMENHGDQLHNIDRSIRDLRVEVQRVLQINLSQSKDLKAMGMALHLITPAIETLIDVADGKPKNGNIAEAYLALKEARQVFNENLIDKMGGT